MDEKEKIFFTVQRKFSIADYTGKENNILEAGMMKTTQSDLDLEQRVWQRISGGEQHGLEPLLRQADAEWAGLRQLCRNGGTKQQRLAALAGQNRMALRGMILLEGGTAEENRPAVPSPTGLLASLCRDSQALCRQYETRCTKSPAFRALYAREQEIFTGLLELLGESV